jgi:hypothetical protein
MSDKLVFDLAQEVEGSPNVFVRKDWLNILDNQNQNYNNNQSIIDTSQLSNSNKYMSYREAYLSIPFVVTIASSSLTSSNPPTATTAGFAPASSAFSADYAVGLKNWFGQIIHSFTLDYNGTTIVQQTPLINMWNSFKLMTSLSYGDVITQGATIGFYPDDPLSWSFNTTGTTGGIGVCNNTNYDIITQVAGGFNNYKIDGGNEGFIHRQQLINFDTAATSGNGTTYATLLPSSSLTLLWKSYITQKQNQTVVGGAQTVAGYIQYSIVATVYLKHIHSFFNMCPLLKGVFMKMTMNLNNTSTTFSCATASAAASQTFAPTTYALTGVSNPLGGVNPLMLASGRTTNITNTSATNILQTASNGGIALFPYAGTTAGAGGAGAATIAYVANISVGSVVLDQTITSLIGQQTGLLSKSIYLYIPAYTFNPVFEQAYLSSPVKQIKYTDVYQYQVINVTASQGMINNLLTNGISNIKSVLVLPFYNPTNANTALPNGMPVWQSPFDPAGTGPTSPLSHITNFNIQISGQNAIYNLQKYSFEQFNNQLYGQNAVNGGLTDGLTSGLIDRQAFDMEYCYYYVNVERMLPVEMSVPKSVQLIGQNITARAMDYICFIEYGVEVSIDALTGARV